MDTSPRALERILSDPHLELLSRVHEAADLIRLYLDHPDLPALPRLSAVGSVLAALCPPPQPDEPLRPPGAPADAEGAALDLASLLRVHPGPATGLLERYAGGQVRVKNRQVTRRPPADRDRLRLPVRPGDEMYERACDLMLLDGTDAARVRLTVILQVLPADILAGLDSDVPFGTLCGARLARRARAAEAPGRRDRPAVSSTALLVVDGQLCGYSAEAVTWDLCERAAVLGLGLDWRVRHPSTDLGGDGPFACRVRHRVRRAPTLVG